MSYFKTRYIFFLVLIIAGSNAVTWTVAQKVTQSRLSNAVADQNNWQKVSKALNADFTLQSSPYSSDGLVEFRKSNDEVAQLQNGNLDMHYPQGFSMNYQFYGDSVYGLYPALYGSSYVSNRPGVRTDLDPDGYGYFENYLNVLVENFSADEKNTNPGTYEASLKLKHDVPTLGHSKSIIDTFYQNSINPLKPFLTGYTTKKVGSFTCTYFNAESQNPHFRMCHIFGQHHEVDFLYRTSVAAGELGDFSPSFNTAKAEAIISASVWSGGDPL